MKTQDEINTIRKEDEKKVQSINAEADTAAAKKGDEIRNKVKKVKDKIQELIDKKHEIFDQPFSKSYVLELAKARLREKKRQWFFDAALVPHMKECQSRAAEPFFESHMRLGLGEKDKVWKMVYAIITEKDLEEAVAMLPDIGMSVAEKEAAVKKIDAEIESFERQIKTELAKL